MSSLDKTMHFDFNQNKGKNVYDTLQDVYNALEEKGGAQAVAQEAPAEAPAEEATEAPAEESAE